MAKYSGLLLSFGSLFLLPTLSATQESESSSNGEARKFADCQATLTAMATLGTDEGSATEENLQNLARGAGLAGAYILHVESNRKTSIKDAKVIIDDWSNVEMTRLTAVLESVGPEKFVEELRVAGEICTDRLKYQEETLNLMREEVDKK